MKKVGLLIVAALFLSSCSFKKGQKDVDIYSNTIKIPNTGEVENKKIKFSEGEKKVYSISGNNNKLSKFDEEIIKMAIKNKNIDLCKSSSFTKKCEEIYTNEVNYFKRKECEKLIYLKQQCEDEKNFDLRKCIEIKDEKLRRRCNFQKKYDEAIKNHDKSFCNLVPRPQRDECLKKIQAN